jgi:hypothetical protein
MNCNCNPPQPVVVRQTKKPGKNLGREFFACPTGACSFFNWTDTPMPSMVKLNRPIASSSSGHGNNLIAQPNNSKGISAKITIHSFSKSSFELCQSSLQFVSRKVSYPRTSIQLSISFPFCREIFDVMKSFEGEFCYYDLQFKLWTFQFELYDFVVAKIRNVGHDVVELPKFLLQGLKKYLDRINPITKRLYEDHRKLNPSQTDDTYEVSLDVGKELMETLLPFQVEGIKFIVERGGRGLIGDEMGKLRSFKL